MKIDHIALYVLDLEMAKYFFIKYFKATANELYYNPQTGLRTYFLKFDDGARLEIMSRPGIISQSNMMRQGFIHIAFSVGSKENVDGITQRLKDDGYMVMSGPRITGDGYYESSIIAFEDNLIEITE